jgi:PhzF family phenazine biosynthesis protein
MKTPIYQVDAFSRTIFSGNPAAVCPLEEWLPDETMQSIAMENNLAETAFFVKEGGIYHLRWFTPKVEVDLCGHATLAAAHVLWDRLECSDPSIAFRTRGGMLQVHRKDGMLALDFPSRPPETCSVHPGLVRALGGEPEMILAARDYLVIYADEESVRALRPDMRALAEIDRFAVIATAPGKEADFVSRFFAPAQGVPEDPVTGSAHCTLIPYWRKRLNKTRLHARQVSERGGELYCELAGDRVTIAGHAALYLEGVIEV